MEFTCEIELAFTFAAGSTEKKEATGVTSWEFDYTPGPSPPGPPVGPQLNSVSVRIYAGPLH